jgi:ubiquinone/menaquinone biosynthesis C-methylase UbiE
MASQNRLLKLIRREQIESVLVPGCYLASDDVQFWLRYGVRKLEGIDVYSLQKRWSDILSILRSRFGSEINFRQGTIESIPFESHTFDLVVSAAVLEHVRNLDAMASETARILRPKGWAWHGFGPLYFSYGGDHCIANYGEKSGYDHLLLNDEQYLDRINDQEFFDRQPDPNAPFWARHQQFSFALATEYLQTFQRFFEIKHVLVVISKAGLQFRNSHPKKWKKLITNGVAEEDLLIKNLYLVMQKLNK